MLCCGGSDEGRFYDFYKEQFVTLLDSREAANLDFHILLSPDNA